MNAILRTVKSNLTLKQAVKAQRRYIYTSTNCLTSALDGVGGQRHSPAALPPPLPPE